MGFFVFFTEQEDYLLQQSMCLFRLLQLNTLYFSALSGFTLCLMTPTAFVPVQCIVRKRLLRQFHIWLRQVLNCLILCSVSYNLLTNKSTAAASFQSLPPCNLWDMVKRNHGDNQTGCGSKTGATTQKANSQLSIHPNGYCLTLVLWAEIALCLYTEPCAGLSQVCE